MFNWKGVPWLLSTRSLQARNLAFWRSSILPLGFDPSLLELKFVTFLEGPRYRILSGLEPFEWAKSAEWVLALVKRLRVWANRILCVEL